MVWAWDHPRVCGEQSCHRPNRFAGRDHPRVCGEQRVRQKPILGLRGSPPRVRGTARPHPRHRAGNRITPACAGNSLISPESYDMMWDHPRVCGEQPPAGQEPRQKAGSPPRVRGTGRGRQKGGASFGITPACAGNSATAPTAVYLALDHPRVCGKQAGPATQQAVQQGSPPRVRGTAAGGYRKGM